MQFTSLLFVLLFLPLSLIIYYLCPKKGKDYIVLILSVIFYSLGSPQYILLFVICAIFTVLIGRMISKTNKEVSRKILLLVGIMCNLMIFVYYKYGESTVVVLNKYILHNITIELPYILLPLGISFYTFKAISYLVDIYNKKTVLDANPIHDLVYLSFFAHIQSGPIARYDEMKTKDNKKDFLCKGIYRFVVGFNKKILIADILSKITSEIFAYSTDQLSTSLAWLGSICYSLQIFYDFSSYSDMAIGISNMFEFDCKENFNYPYMTESISKFWRRWHISLSNWFRDYIYIPLGGSRSDNKYRVYLNLLVVWIATGVWHGLKKHYIVWALLFFIVIAFERFTGLPNELKSRFGKMIYRVIALLFINIQWIIFYFSDIGKSFKYIKRMFIYSSNAIRDLRSFVLIKDYIWFIVVAIVLCFPILEYIKNKIKNKKIYILYEVLSGVVVSLCFVWAISFVINGQYNPFAYANF